MAVKGDRPVGGQIPKQEPVVGVGCHPPLPPGGARPPFLLPLQGALETLEGQEEGGGTESHSCYQMLVATPSVPPQAVFNLAQAPPPPRTWAS